MKNFCIKIQTKERKNLVTVTSDDYIMIHCYAKIKGKSVKVRTFYLHTSMGPDKKLSIREDESLT